MLRKFRRDNLRKKVGGKNLKNAWESLQMEKYGKDYKKVCSRKRGKYNG